MRYYKIAGIVFKVIGSDLHAQRLMSAYEVDECPYDVKIEVCESCNIPMPKDVKIIRTGTLRTFASTDSGYLTYDALNDGTLIALITMDKQVREVRVVARDIESMGGASLSVRKFNMLAEVFKYAVLVRGGMVFHSSALSVKGGAILFSAPSGTGKSTHTGLWCRYVKGSEVFNDDSPAIMIEDGQIVAYGTPWSGKSDVNINVRLKLLAVVFLERGSDNAISEIFGREKFLRFASQSFCSPFSSLAGRTFDFQERVCGEVPMYKLKCNVSEGAVKTVFDQIFEGENYES